MSEQNSEGEIRSFEIKVAERDIELILGNCVVVLFRQQQELDYLAIELEEEESTLRIFNNAPFARWMGGLAIRQDIDGSYVYDSVTMNGESFHELTGWNPPVIIKQSPTEQEMEMWLDINAGGIDKEWEQFREHPREQ